MCLLLFPTSSLLFLLLSFNLGFISFPIHVTENIGLMFELVRSYLFFLGMEKLCLVWIIFHSLPLLRLHPHLFCSILYSNCFFASVIFLNFVSPSIFMNIANPYFFFYILCPNFFDSCLSTVFTPRFYLSLS